MKEMYKEEGRGINDPVFGRDHRVHSLHEYIYVWA